MWICLHLQPRRFLALGAASYLAEREEEALLGGEAVDLLLLRKKIDPWIRRLIDILNVETDLRNQRRDID